MEEQETCWKYNESSSKHSHGYLHSIISELSASQTIANSYKNSAKGQTI